MRCLVTGATGFIGRRLLEALLSAGHDVRCLVRSTSRVDALRSRAVELREGDVVTGAGLDEAVARIDVVFHLAGTTRGRSPADFFPTNVDGVQRLLEACRRQITPPVVVAVSSLAAAGPSSAERPNAVADPSRPVSNYGRSKLAGEDAARRFATTVPVTIVRPPIVFGGGDPATFEWFRTLARFRVHLIPSSGSHRYSLVHVDDLVDFLQLAAANGVRLTPSAEDAAGLYYVAHSESPNYVEIGRHAAAALGIKRYLTLRVPLGLMWLYGHSGEFWGRLRRRAPLVGVDKIQEAAAGSWLCSSAEAQRLGFVPSMTLDEQFRRTVEWYREHRWL